MMNFLMQGPPLLKQRRPSTSLSVAWSARSDLVLTDFIHCWASCLFLLPQLAAKCRMLQHWKVGFFPKWTRSSRKDSHRQSFYCTSTQWNTGKYVLHICIYYVHTYYVWLCITYVHCIYMYIYVYVMYIHYMLMYVHYTSMYIHVYIMYIYYTFLYVHNTYMYIHVYAYHI